MGDHRVRGGLSRSLSSGGGLARGLATAVWVVVLALPAAAPCAPALAAGAAAGQRVSSSPAPGGPVALRLVRAAGGRPAGTAAGGRGHGPRGMSALGRRHGASTRGTAPADGAINRGWISGTVTAADGGARLSGVEVRVFTGGGQGAGFGITGADGAYVAGELDPAVGGYRVCFDAAGVRGDRAPLGYASQCYRDVPWTLGSMGITFPAPGATPVSVTALRSTPGIDAALGAAGGISGTVTAAAGARLSGVHVEVYASTGQDAGSAVTGADGTYRVTELNPAVPGYRVCFDAGDARGGNPPFGYASQCYRDVSWGGGNHRVPSATPVPVVAGRGTPGVDAALAAAGGISGTVTAAVGGARLSDVGVRVYTSTDEYELLAFTGADGTYRVTGLPAQDDYRVCFDTSYAAGGSSTAGYFSQCYRDVPWAGGDGPVPGATPVPVVAGRLTPGVDAALVARGDLRYRHRRGRRDPRMSRLPACDLNVGVVPATSMRWSRAWSRPAGRVADAGGKPGGRAS